MKFLGNVLISTMLLSLLVACGKDNKSGKSSVPAQATPLVDPYSMNAYTANSLGLGNAFGTTPGWGNIQNVSQAIVAAALAENRCINGGQRYSFTLPLGPNGTVLNDVFMGVTSRGDVAVIIGNGVGGQATLIGYYCAGATGMPSMAPQLLSNPMLGSRSPAGCKIKPMNASVVVQGQIPTRMDFRWADGGTSPLLGPVMKFSFCDSIFGQGMQMPPFYPYGRM